MERQALESELEGLEEPRRALDARRQEASGAGSAWMRFRGMRSWWISCARSISSASPAATTKPPPARWAASKCRQAALLEELAGVLEHYGEARPASAATARARLNSLADRNALLLQALSDERAVTGQLEENSAARDAAAGSLGTIYSERRRWRKAT